jgi:hypothetical protein
MFRQTDTKLLWTRRRSVEHGLAFRFQLFFKLIRKVLRLRCKHSREVNHG